VAGWSRREVADDARLRMLLELGQVELAKAYLKAVEHRVTEEDDDAPDVTAEQVNQLRALGLWRTLEELITKQMADRSRSRRARDKKRHVTSRDDTRHNVTSREDTDNTTRQRSYDPSPSEKSLQNGGSPSAPAMVQSRKKPSREMPADWAPSEAHRAKARELGIDLDHEEELFRNDAAANARRYADWEAAFRNWIARSAKWKKPAGAPAKPAIVKGWNDETHMNGIPKGTSW
jgi:hypothetical protein